jgi:type-F conjugative transfer system secretin TraK
MHKHLLSLLFLIPLCFLPCTYALQVKAAKDNETLFFKISNKEYSRIFVAGDRIASVKGKSNLYEIKEFKHQYDDGVLYIKPSLSSEQHSFSIFITTEQGHNFTLLLASLAIPAENIGIKPLAASKSLATRWESNLPYTQALVELIQHMANMTHPEGYAVILLGKVNPTKRDKGLMMQLLTIYRGGFLQGEIWKLKNVSLNTLSLQPREFYHHNVRAVSLVNEQLQRSEETFLYRIVSHE